MIRFLGRRLLWAVFILWFVSTVTFFGSLRIGDPVATLAGPHASARDRAYIRTFYHLDRPAVVQYGYYLRGLSRGDLGKSFRYRRPVASLIAERFPRTLLLGSMTLMFQFVVGVLVGTWAAARRGHRDESLVLGATFVGISTPTFLSGKLFLIVLAYRLGWFPIGGYGAGFLDHVRHGVLPAIVLGLLGTAYEARLVRNELSEVLQSDFVRTARAKGLGPVAVVLRHGLRNALLPVVTSLGLSLGSLFGGAIVTEAIFAWPGLGRLAFESIVGLDVPVIMGLVLFSSTGILVGSLFADLAYASLDPRIRRA
ncbi:MAG: ABC transporter permease [Deltaproteobacteria bacterium]|nr:ABC transporter permease [Deltaproteobacteria bacterium]